VVVEEEEAVTEEAAAVGGINPAIGDQLNSAIIGGLYAVESAFCILSGRLYPAQW
jgi:hypothetical protein